MATRITIGNVEILHGDCRRWLASMEADSVHCVVTSPPYWGLRDYGNPPSVWGGDLNCEHDWDEQTAPQKRSGGTESSTLGEASGGHAISDKARVRSIERSMHDGRPSSFCRRCTAWRGNFGLEPSLGLHIDHLVEIFREVRRVLRPDGTVWLNYGDCYATGVNGRSAADTKALSDDDRTFRDKPFSTVGPVYDPDGGAKGGGYRGENKGNTAAPGGRVVAGGTLKAKDLCMMPARVALALQADGWWIRSEIIWAKPNPMPESTRDRPTSSHEKIYLLSQSERYWYDAEAVRENRTKDEDANGFRGGSYVGGEPGPRTTTGNKRIKMPDGWDTGPGAHGTIHRAGREKGRTRGLPPRHAQYESSDRSTLDDVGRGGGRNMRNVWHIATAPFPEAHFATFPEKLVEPCIKAGTSERGCCPHCGAGWVRNTKTEYSNPGNRTTNGDRSLKNRDQTAGFLVRLEKQVKTLGWSPPCECYDGRYRAEFAKPRSARKRSQRDSWGGRWRRVRSRPGLSHWPVTSATIMDPFGGSGTVGVVAHRLNRRALLIELNPGYIEIAARRIEKATAQGDMFIDDHGSRGAVEP